MSDLLAFQDVATLLRYNPKTGDLVWRRRPRKYFNSDRACNAWNARYEGRVAGCVCGPKRRKYIALDILRTPYHAHRIAWLLYNGVWPEKNIDHIDGNSLNNRASNLRDVSLSVNNRNAMLKKNSSSGVNGVSKSRGRWRAYICVDGRFLHLGIFDSKLKAVSARKNAEDGLGFTTRHGVKA